MELIIGNKNYSSWSLRPWILMKMFAVEFNETRLALFEDEFLAKIKNYTPAGKVPVLIDGDTKIWDSLAICEYINERYLQGQGWPEALTKRAEARALCCEMHAGFMELRSQLPMNFRAKRQVVIDDVLQAEINRVDQMWQSLLTRKTDGGNWLFGRFGIVDAFYIPVALRFNSYGIALSEQSQQYVDQVLAMEPLQPWLHAAEQETEVIEIAEVGR